MSQVYQKADPSFFSDMSKSKNFISYPHSSYPCSKFNKPLNSDTQSNVFRSDDDSSNDNSLEEMDAVKRFCNLSKTDGSDESEQNFVINNDDVVNNALPNVDYIVDVTNGNLAVHSEDANKDTISNSSENISNKTNCSSDILSENVSEDTEPNISGENSTLSHERNIIPDLSSTCDQIREISNASPSTISDQQSLEEESPKNKNHTQDSEPSTTIKEHCQNDKASTGSKETDIESHTNGSSGSTSPEKLNSNSPPQNNRPTRQRPPSLKLIEAAWGGRSWVDPSVANFCGKMTRKVLPKRESLQSSLPSLVSAGDMLSVSLPERPGLPLPNFIVPPSLILGLKTTTTEFQATPTIKDGDTSPWPILGEGWVKKEVMRRNGLSAGRYDIYYISPGGVKVRSKPELQLLVGDTLDLSNFNFRLGEFLPTMNGRPNPKRKKKSGTLPDMPDLVVAEEKEALASIITINSRLDVGRRPNLTTSSPNLVTSPPSLVASSLSPMTSSDERAWEDLGIGEYKEKLVRCKKCENCVRENCGKCAHCKDMKQFGGTNSRRQSCVLRKCNQTGPHCHIMKVIPTLPPNFISSFQPSDSTPHTPNKHSPSRTSRTCKKHVNNKSSSDNISLSTNSSLSKKETLTPTVIAYKRLKIHKKSIKVKIAVKGKRLRETPPSSSNKRPRMFHSVESLQTPSLETRQPESPARHAQIPCTATGLQKYINLSPVPQEFNLPASLELSVKIADKTHCCPLLWIDDLFHSQTIHHFNKNVRNATTIPPPPAQWPSLLTNFYNFTFQFTVTLNDVQFQFHVVEKVKVQTKKVSQYVKVYGSHVRDISVDCDFYQFLEFIELYHYLPDHPKNVAESNCQPMNMDDEMKNICDKLTNLITSNPRIDEGLRKLLIKYLKSSDLCTFILAVVNSNTVPSEFEAAVVEILRRDLNLQDISNLTDLTGLSLSGQQPEVAAVETVPGNSTVEVPVEKLDINKTLSSLVPDDSPINEKVRNFILNDPLKVIEMINELQKNPSGKPLNFETLSKMILEISKPKEPEVVHIKTERIEQASPPRALLIPPVQTIKPPVVVPGRSHHVPMTRQTVPYPHPAPPAQFIPRTKQPTPPGYNPRYYTPHLSPQHQQRYGRPPLRRAAPNLGAIQHIAAPVIPAPKTGPRMKDIRKIAPPAVFVNKAVQVKPTQRTVQQQVSLKPVPKSRAKREKFVDLDFCPHV